MSVEKKQKFSFQKNKQFNYKNLERNKTVGYSIISIIGEITNFSQHDHFTYIL